MKKSHLRVVSWIFVGSFAWLSSCVKEDNDDCAKQCDVLIVKAIDSDSESVKDNVGVYLFDENLKLEKTINSKLDTNIKNRKSFDQEIYGCLFGSYSRFTLANRSIGYFY